MKPATWIQVLPTRRMALPVQDVRAQAAGKVSRTVRPNGFRIELADLGRRTAHFFRGVWREIKELFLPVHALGEEQLACVGYLREAGIGGGTDRLVLAREMTRVFNREYHRISNYGVLGYKDTRWRASRTAAKAVVRMVVRKEKAAGRRILKEQRDLLKQNLESLKEPQPAIQSNRLGAVGNWAGRPEPTGKSDRSLQKQCLDTLQQAGMGTKTTRNEIARRLAEAMDRRDEKCAKATTSVEILDAEQEYALDAASAVCLDRIELQEPPEPEWLRELRSPCNSSK